MLVKCICTNCAGHLEFEEENAGTKIDCPHCGFETALFLPGNEPPDLDLMAFARKRQLRRRAIQGVMALILVGAIGYALYRWGLSIVEGWLPETESKVIPVLVLIGGCLLIPVVLIWLLFPLLMVLQLRKLNHVLERLEENSRPASPEELMEQDNELQEESSQTAATEIDSPEPTRGI